MASPGPGPTLFVEANALLAVQQGDEQMAYECLDRMLLGELVTLADAAGTLAGMARWKAEVKQREVAGG
jgi:hypothetical protein